MVRLRSKRKKLRECDVYRCCANGARVHVITVTAGVSKGGVGNLGFGDEISVVYQDVSN